MGSKPNNTPSLFSVDQLPPRPDLVEIAKKAEYTGKILTKNQELCADIVQDLLTGVSQRRIAREYHISRNSIQAIVDALEARGELEPLKKRLSKKLGQVIEMGVDTSLEMLEAGTVPANVLPIMIGVLSDKKALLDGDPTVREERVVREVTPADVNAMFEQMKRAQATTVVPAALPAPALDTTSSPSTDSQSDGLGEKHQ